MPDVVTPSIAPVKDKIINYHSHNLIQISVLPEVAVAEWLVRTAERTVRARVLARALRCVLGQNTLLS